MSTSQAQAGQGDPEEVAQQTSSDSRTGPQGPPRGVRTTPRAAARTLPSRPASATCPVDAEPVEEDLGERVFVYDEWDHIIADYRHGWCALREIDLADDAGLFFTRTLERYAPLVPEIRRHFQRVRPESFRTLRGLEDGENFDLNAVIDARAERRARRSPSAKLYTARARLEREVATLFLLDMSASTDEAPPGAGAGRRIIDIEKEALVIMAAALEEIGDAFAIYGFSGQGRHNVEFYPVKGFAERLAAGAKGRIGGIQPRGSTRMGTALRHATRRLAAADSNVKLMILLTDGKPYDSDTYQDDAYAQEDTKMALRDAGKDPRDGQHTKVDTCPPPGRQLRDPSTTSARCPEAARSTGA